MRAIAHREVSTIIPKGREL